MITYRCKSCNTVLYQFQHSKINKLYGRVLKKGIGLLSPSDVSKILRKCPRCGRVFEISVDWRKSIVVRRHGFNK